MIYEHDDDMMDSGSSQSSALGYTNTLHIYSNRVLPTTIIASKMPEYSAERDAMMLFTYFISELPAETLNIFLDLILKKINTTLFQMKEELDSTELLPKKISKAKKNAKPTEDKGV